MLFTESNTMPVILIHMNKSLLHSDVERRLVIIHHWLSPAQTYKVLLNLPRIVFTATNPGSLFPCFLNNFAL